MKGGQEGGSRAYHSIRWLISFHLCGSILPDRGRWERSEHKRREGGKEGELEMVVVSIWQRNTALRVLLKRPHKPELSEVGGHILTIGHTNIDCRFSAWPSWTPSSSSTCYGNRQNDPWKQCTQSVQCSIEELPWIVTLASPFKTHKVMWQNMLMQSLLSSIFWIF